MPELYTDEEMSLIRELTQGFANVLNKFMDDNVGFSVDDRSCMIQHSLCDILLSFIMAASKSGYEKEVLDDIYEDVADAIELYSKPAGQMMN